MKSILQMREKIKTWFVNEETSHILVIICIALFGILGLGIWNLGLHSKDSIEIEYLAKETKNTEQGLIVASKNSTKYYFLHCSGVKRIQDKNKIYFSSEEEARAAGYILASGCK